VGGRVGSVGGGVGEATDGGGVGLVVRLSSQLSPLRLPWAFTKC